VDGLSDLIRHYKLDMKVTQLVNLVANALVLPEKVAAPAAEEPALVGAAAEEKPLAGRTIVVADDDPDQVVYLSAVLSDAGATIIEAADGDEALEACRKEKPDLLTLDLEMPGLPSHDVFARLRSEMPDLRICIVTGRPELRRTIYDQDARRPEGYMDKPVTEESLLRNVRKVLETS
jgi:CheY-like chemotaxis protein